MPSENPRQLLEYLAEGLVEDPEAVSVEQFEEDDGTIVLELCVGAEDYGRIIGRGFHMFAGEAHAEVLALQEAGSAAKGATLYVTLEPCAHQGKTPPCADAVVKAGIGRVVYGQSEKALKAMTGYNFPSHADGERTHARILELVLDGSLRPVVGRAVPFEDLPEALQAMADRQTMGRNVALVPGQH